MRGFYVLCNYILIAQLSYSSSSAEPDMSPIVMGVRAWKRHTEVSLGPYRSRRLRYGPRLTEECLFQGCTEITMGGIIIYQEFV